MTLMLMNLYGISKIVDFTRSCSASVAVAAVEVVWTERNRGKLLVLGIEEAASTSVSWSNVMSAQVVDDSIDVNPEMDRFMNG